MNLELFIRALKQQGPTTKKLAECILTAVKGVLDQATAQVQHAFIDSCTNLTKAEQLEIKRKIPDRVTRSGQ